MKKKVSKQDIERAKRVISKIRDIQSQREKKYKGKLAEQKERTKKVFSGVSSAVKTKRNILKQSEETLRKWERTPSKKKETFKEARKRYDDLIRKQSKLREGIESAQKNLREQQKKERIQGFKTKALILGSKVESGTEVALAKASQKLGQLAKKKVKTRKILKKSKTSYKMPSRKVENIFEDENRFFKGAMRNGML